MESTDGGPVPDEKLLVVADSPNSYSSETLSVYPNNVWISQRTSLCREIVNLDLILLEGKLKRGMICTVQVTKDGDCKEGHILLNDVVRKKLDVSAGDNVSYKFPVTVERGSEIFISPMNQEIAPANLLQHYIGPFFKKNLFLAIHENDIFTAPHNYARRSAEFKIVRTVPSPFCIVCPESMYFVEYATEIDANVEASNYHVGDTSKSQNAEKMNNIPLNNRIYLDAECSALSAFAAITTSSSGYSTHKKMKVATEQHDKMFMTVLSQTISPPPQSLPSPSTLPLPPPSHVFENILKIEFDEEEPEESEPIRASPMLVPAPEDQESPQSGPTGFGAESISEDWKEECDRISTVISKLIPLRLSRTFHENCEAYVGEKPVDLHLIQSRLDDRYYHRPSAIRADIESISTSAAKMWEPGTKPCKVANSISDLLEKIVGEPNLKELTYEIYRQYELTPNKSESKKQGKTGTMNTAPSCASNKRSSSSNMRVPPVTPNNRYRTRTVANHNRNNSFEDAQDNSLNSRLPPQKTEAPRDTQRASRYGTRARGNASKVNYSENQRCLTCDKDFYTVEELENHEQTCGKNTGFVSLVNQGASDIQIIEGKSQKVNPVKDPVNDDDFTSETLNSSDSENDDQNDVVIGDTLKTVYNSLQQTNNTVKSPILNKVLASGCNSPGDADPRRPQKRSNQQTESAALAFDTPHLGSVNKKFRTRPPNNTSLNLHDKDEKLGQLEIDEDKMIDPDYIA